MLDKYKKEIITCYKEEKKDVHEFFYSVKLIWRKFLKITGLLLHNLKSIFWIAIIGFIIWLSVSDVLLDSLAIPDFPVKKIPKTVTFDWKYNKQEYTISEVFYKTAYDYYKTNPLKNFYEDDNYGEYYTRLLNNISAPEDNTISEIVNAIVQEAEKNNLTTDETAELIVSFVQSIPYDDDKYNAIEYGTEVDESWPRFPYEILYDNEGICLGKTFLTIALLKKIGYGTAIFDFVNDDHVAPAVKCPIEYSYNNSGYCYAESTAIGFKIGDEPTSEFDNGQAQARIKVTSYSSNSNSSLISNNPANIAIYNKTDGNSYQGVIETYKTTQRIKVLEKDMENLSWNFSILEKEIDQLENDVLYYQEQAESLYRTHEILGDYASYDNYERAYDQYESISYNYESKADAYNAKVNRYNNLVYEYNAIIEEFYE